MWKEASDLKGRNGCSVKTKLSLAIQIKGPWRWKINLHLIKTLPCFSRPPPFVSDTRIPDASEEITLPFNSHTLWKPWLRHNYCLFLLTIYTDLLQSLPFIQFAPQIILTSSLFNQLSFLTWALCCLDVCCFQQSQLPEACSVSLVPLKPLSHFCSFWVDPHPEAPKLIILLASLPSILIFLSNHDFLFCVK